MSAEEFKKELEKGGKFVMFPYAISIIVMTFKRSSEADDSAIKYGYKYLLISLLLGWWGVPWGPVYTVQSIVKAFSGKDVTKEVLEEIKK